MVNISSEENVEFEPWLRQKNRHDFAVVIASRIALRAIPAMATLISNAKRTFSARNALKKCAAFRASEVVWNSAAYPSDDPNLKRAADVAAAWLFDMVVQVGTKL
jgi:hypothetical protein